MRRHETVRALGASVIGAGWTALLLAAGEALIVEFLRGRKALAAQL